MKKIILLTTLIICSCTMKPSATYIGPQTCATDHMTPELMLSLGRLSDPQLSPDGSLILYGVSYIDVAQNRSCRNLLITSPDGAVKVELTHEGKSISNARWIDGGKSIVYLQGGQIYKAPLRGSGASLKLGRRTQLSDVPAGISEFSVSPDGSKIMYVSTVKSHVQAPVDLYSDLAKADAIITNDLMYRHWDHWVKELPHTFVASLEGGAKSITPAASRDILPADEALFELPIEPLSGIEQLCWSPDSKFIAYSCKKQMGKDYAFSTNCEIYIYNVSTGVSALIPMGGGYDTDPAWSPDGAHLAWLSMERNGYEADKSRIMMASIDYALIEAATAGTELEAAQQNAPLALEVVELTADFKYNAAGLVWEDASHLWFHALSEGLQAVYCYDFSAITRATNDDLWYDFSTPFGFERSEEGLNLLTIYCSMNFPAEIVRINGSELSRISCENDALLGQCAEPIYEKRYIKTVDGKDMLTWVLKPADFDEAKVYPAIEICLGGPQGTLSQGWSYRWNYRMMAEQGYVVVLPNRRGTTAFGQEWTEQISGDYIGLNMQDYLSAARYIKAQPWVGKLAACGASYGGYSVYYLCGIHEGIFDCFIAHAGIFNQEHMYMSTEEMFFPTWDNGGAPWDTNPTAVRHYSNSPHTLVTRWNTPLLVIHGGMDFRVPVDQGMAAYNAAQMMGVPSKLLIFPDENHWILSPQNGLLWHREYFAWLTHWLTD